MADTQPFQSKTLYDSLSTFESGINSDPNPLLLPKNTLAWSRNASLRGGFIKQRPPYFNRQIIFPSEDVRVTIQLGNFQGAGYLRPDFGPQQLVAQINGRLFSFTLGTNNIFTAAEITVPGDPNDSTSPQVWMNQAEKWLIITDGSSKLPIFYDGISSRRSFGPSVKLGEVASSVPANFPSPRVIGEIIQVTTLAPWTAGFNFPVIFNGAFYQPVASTTAAAEYEVVLTTVTHAVGQAGTTIPTGSNLVVKALTAGQITNVGVIGSFTCRTNWEYFIDLSTPYVGSTGDVLSLVSTPVSSCVILPVANYQWTVTAIITPTRINVQRIFADSVLATIAVGQTISGQGANQPEVILGTTVANFVLPAIGGTATVKINKLFPGPDGTLAWIGTAQFSVVAVPPPAVTTVVSLINISDTANAGAAVPTGNPGGDIFSVPELPAGRMGAYGLGHQTMSLVDGISFIYGDAVGGPSGTPAYNYRDSVLKTTENSYLFGTFINDFSGSGSFRIPNSGELITSMRFATVLDASYGQGPLQVGTPNSIFTCAVPPVRADWAKLENPILTETLIGRGPLAQNSTISVNSDVFFRTMDGVGSMVFGRREFLTWGNVPLSSEVNRVLLQDDKALLGFGSATTFDNRYFIAAHPVASVHGTSHLETPTINFDPLSSIRGKAPSIWESDWDSINAFQYITGIFASTERCLVFALNAGVIEIDEILPEITTEIADNGTTPITFELESASLFNKDVKPPEILISLRDAEIAVGNLQGLVTFSSS